MLKEACKDADFYPDKVLKDNDTFICRWDWCKWYEEYPEIEAVVNVLNKLDDEHDPSSKDGLGYKFLRSGEDYSDIEERSNDNDYDLDLYVVHEIYVPKDLEEVSLDEPDMEEDYSL